MYLSSILITICQFPTRHLWEGVSSHLKSVCKPFSKHLSMLLRLLAYCLCCSGVVVGPPPKSTFPQSFPQNGTMARREMGESCVYIFEAVLQVTSLRFVVPFSWPTQAAHNRDTCTWHMWTYTTATHRQLNTKLRHENKSGVWMSLWEREHWCDKRFWKSPSAFFFFATVTFFFLCMHLMSSSGPKKNW